MLSNICICFLIKRPNFHNFKFYNKLNKEGYQVFVLVDNEFDIKKEQFDLKYLKVSEKDCLDNGFTDSSTATIPKKIISWDKALYFFCKAYHNFDHVWLIEDDVFIPNTKSLKSIDKKYPKADLLSSSNRINKDGNLDTWNHWQIAKNNFELPWASSMICAVRLSKKLLYEIARARIEELLEIIIINNINLVSYNKKVKKVFLNISDNSHMDCFSDLYSYFFSKNNFNLKFSNRVTTEDLIHNVNRLVHYGWKKEAIPITQLKKSILARFFDVIFD